MVAFYVHKPTPNWTVCLACNQARVPATRTLPHRLQFHGNRCTVLKQLAHCAAQSGFFFWSYNSATNVTIETGFTSVALCLRPTARRMETANLPIIIIINLFYAKHITINKRSRGTARKADRNAYDVRYYSCRALSGFRNSVSKSNYLFAVSN